MTCSSRSEIVGAAHQHAGIGKRRIEARQGQRGGLADLPFASLVEVLLAEAFAVGDDEHHLAPCLFEFVARHDPQAQCRITEQDLVADHALEYDKMAVATVVDQHNGRNAGTGKRVQ